MRASAGRVWSIGLTAAPGRPVHIWTDPRRRLPQQSDGRRPSWRHPI